MRRLPLLAAAFAAGWVLGAVVTVTWACLAVAKETSR